MIPIKDNMPTDRFPLVTLGLILANAVAYLLAVAHGGSLISGPDAAEIYRYGAIPQAFTRGVQQIDLQSIAGTLVIHPLPAWETAFTSMFMHASIIHLAGNMLFLWIFGNNVEDSLGRLRFLGFYILGGLAALALQVLLSPDSAAPTIGASGAIAGVLGGYILLYPRARVLTLVLIILFFTVIELPAIVMLGVWFAEQALFAATDLTNPSGGGGGVAYFAHVGGFAFGVLTVRLLARRQKAVPPWRPMNARP